MDIIRKAAATIGKEETKGEVSKVEQKLASLKAAPCYVSGNFAYFTTRPLADQWGDDWNDAPYEHNAGTPYRYSDKEREMGIDYQVYRIAFDADLDEPNTGCFNSPYSVEMINAGAIAWLRSSAWSDHKICIRAGATIEEFVSKIKEAGGEVFIPISLME